MITHLLAFDAIQEKINAMPKKPTPKHKGIPIGSYETIKDAAGKMTVKPKVSRKTSVSAKIAQRKSKKVKPVRRTAWAAR